MLWVLPTILVLLLIGLSIPVGLFMGRVLDDRWTPPRPLARIERLFDTGPQGWMGYSVALLSFNVVIWLWTYFVLALQHHLPLNPDGKGPLDPTTVFNTVCSFLSNTNLQHYAGEQHLSYFAQIFAIQWCQFVSAGVGIAAMVAIARGLRGDPTMGNFSVDLWRACMYLLLPLAFIVACLLILCGMPMTFSGTKVVTTLEGATQAIARGPVAALVAIKQIGTNGGGFFGANSAHPFENPNWLSNLIESWAILAIPMATIVMFGRLIRNLRHAMVIDASMLLLLVGLLALAIIQEAKPNPAFTGHPRRTYPAAQPDGRPTVLPAVVGLPVAQPEGNLEGKEVRFGGSAAATWATLTTVTSNGSVNCTHDSLNPLTLLVPLTGMWLNCIFGGVGVGLINLLVYLIVGVFLAGLMVSRTPEYLGKKIEAREMKLAMLALLIHPVMILGPTGLSCVTGWADGSKGNPAAHGFSETLYEFTSASANNGSETGGLNAAIGSWDNPSKPPFAHPYDIVDGLVMLISRFVPILAPLAIAGSLAAKKPTPFTSGTMRTDTLTFGLVLIGTILLVGALLFMPAAVLGPIAEHLGPIPFVAP